jgi:thiol-disulfide isomerase/thioredoxin
VADENDQKAAPGGNVPEAARHRKAGYPILELAVTLGALGIVVLGILLVENWRDRSSQPSSAAAPVFTDLNGNPIEVELGVVSGGRAALGKPAADFQLVDPDGRLLTLADYRGQPVLVNFWATWCVPCRREVPDFVQLQAEWGDSVQIVGVNLQERAVTVSQFAADFQMNYPLALDLDGEVTKAYRLTGLPETFFVDSAGILRDHRIGAVEPEIARCIVDGMLAGNHDPKDCR